MLAIALGVVSVVPNGAMESKVYADTNSYVELNEDFDSAYTVYFELKSPGKVRFKRENGDYTTAKLWKVYDNGNEESITSGYWTDYRLGVGKYKIKTDYSINQVEFTQEGDDCEKEWNDTLDTANEIEVNKSYTGNLNSDCYDYYDYYHSYYGHTSSDKDYYKFQLNQPGKVQVEYYLEDLSTGYRYDNDNENTIAVYTEDADGNVNEIFQVLGKDTSNKTRYSSTYRLPKGTYYILVKNASNSDASYYYADVTDYQLKVNYTAESADAYEQEYNNTAETANRMDTDKVYTGNLSTSEDVDYYKFTLPDRKKVKIKTQIPRQSTDKLFTFGLYKANATSKIVEVKTNTNPVSYTTEKELEAGEYYVVVKKGDTGAESTVDYNFTVMTAPVPTPTIAPTATPTVAPTIAPTATPTMAPTATPTVLPTMVPTTIPTATPTIIPSVTPTQKPTETPAVTATPGKTETPSVTATPIIAATVTPNPNEKPLPIPTSWVPEPTASAVATVKPIRTPVTTILSTKTPTPSTATPVIQTPEVTPTVAPIQAPTATPEITPTVDPDIQLIETMYVDCEKDDDEVIRVGEKFMMYASVEPEELEEDAEILWTSSDQKIAKISEKGEVTCKKAGTVTITAQTTDGSNITVEKTLTIKPALSSVNTLSKMGCNQGKLTPKFSKYRTTYSLVLGKNMSSTIISATKTDSKSIMKINGKTCNKIKVSLKKGKKKTVKIVVTAQNGKKRTYKLVVKRKK